MDVVTKCNVDDTSGRNKNKYDRDMHVIVQLQHRVEDEVEPHDYDVGISLDSDVDEEGDTCVSSACKSSACEVVLINRLLNFAECCAAQTLSCNNNNCFLPQLQ